MTTVLEKLANMDIADETRIHLRLEKSVDFRADWGSSEQDALDRSGMITDIIDFIFHSEYIFPILTWGEENFLREYLIEECENEGLLYADVEEGMYDEELEAYTDDALYEAFREYLTEHDSWVIEKETYMHDYKYGYYLFQAEFFVTYGNMKNSSFNFSDWDVSVETAAGRLRVEK